MRSMLARIFVGLGLFLAVVSPGFSQKCTEPGSIKQVSSRSAGDVEYVIFDVVRDPDSEDSAPVYSVKNASPPFTGYIAEDGEIPVKGKRFKEIVFRSINWMCEIRVKRTIPKAAVEDVKLLYSFEGIADFVVGYSARSRYAGTYHYDAGPVTKVVMKFLK